MVKRLYFLFFRQGTNPLFSAIIDKNTNYLSGIPDSPP